MRNLLKPKTLQRRDMLRAFLAKIRRALVLDDVPDSGPLRHAYDAGYNSYGTGTRNPHQPGTGFYRFWERGYDTSP